MYLTLNQTQFDILKLTGEEHLSAPFRFTVDIKPALGEDVSKYLLYSAELHIQDRTISGVITETRSRLLDDYGNEQATITLEPLLALAKSSTDTRTFQAESIQAIITKLLISLNYHPSLIKFHFANKKKALATQKQPYLLQYGETNLEFINRLAAKAGLFYWLTYDKQLPGIHFSDDNSYVPEGNDIHYNPKASFDTPAVLKVEGIYQVVTTNITTIDHDPKFPSNQIIGKFKGQGIAQTYYGMGATNTDQANQLADLLAKINQAEAFKVNGNSNIKELAVGTTIKLFADDYYLAPGRNLDLDLDGTYLVEHVKHILTPEGYSNEFGLHPVKNPYKIPIPKPEILPGIFQARTRSKDDQPEINQDGSYYLKPEFERQEMPFIYTIPRLSPYGDMSSKFADEAGWHTPIVGEVETLVSSLDGNPDRPVILGTLHHKVNISPIVLKNDEHHILKSPGSNQLLMSDKYHNEAVNLSTPGQVNYLNLSAENFNNNNNHKIDLTSQTGKVTLQAQKDINLTSGAAMKETSNDNRTELVTGNHTTTATDLSQCANTDYQTQATSNLRIEATQNITAKSGKDLNLTAQQIDIHNQNAQAIYTANQGNIIIETPKELRITSAAGTIEIGQNGAGMKLSADGKIELNTKNLNIKVDEIVHYGNTMSKVNQGEFKLTDIQEPNIPKDNSDWGASGRGKKKAQTNSDDNVFAMQYPLEAKYRDQGYHSGSRSFGYERDNGARAHAGCDLYADAGAEVRAVADGVVLQNHDFYERTFALVIDHGDFIVRYGEIQPPKHNHHYTEGIPPESIRKGFSWKSGDKIKKKDLIGYVGKRFVLDKNKNYVMTGNAMLHFELYKKTCNGDLTQKQNQQYDYVPIKHYDRRRDLLDPTKSLDNAESWSE